MSQSSPEKSSPVEPPHGYEVSRHLFRRLYDWTLHWAHTPYGVPALFLLAVAESSVFPVPPDVLLIALALSRREKALYFALVCSVGSVLGGVVGYLIGYAAWEAVGPFFLQHVINPAAFERVGQWYQEGAFWWILIAAFTPIPYKVFTIAAGVYHDHIPLWILVAASSVGRSARFFLVGGLLYLFGDRMRGFVEKYFDWLLWVFMVLLILGFVVAKVM